MKNQSPAYRPTRPMRPNERWSLDTHLSDLMVSGVRFHILSVVDDFTREVLAMVPRQTFSAAQVVEALDALITARACPAACVSDHAATFTGREIRRWSEEKGVVWLYTGIGMPRHKSLVERKARSIPIT